MTWRLAVGCWALSAVLGGAQREATRPNVLLITLDTVRADRMGFLGSTRGLTPSLDALARESIVFTRAYAQAPVTTVSHATLLTGTYPPFHGVVDFGLPLPPEIPYLPDLFHQRGYRTAAFVGSLVLDPRGGTAPGFDRGVDVYDAGFRMRRPGEDRYATLERRGDEVVARALQWLGTARGAPFFLWVHLYDAHDPYDPPSDLKARFAAAPYDGEIASVDRLVGRLIGALRSRQLLEDTSVVIAADHGEALGGHGEDTHGVFLYDETVHVPLVLRLPRAAHAGTRVTARVRLADVAPTLVEIAGTPHAAAMQGESLLPLLRSARPPDRPAYAETQYPRRGFGWSPLVSWRDERFLFVRAPRRELYDVVADPAQATNIAGQRSRVADGIEAAVEQFVRTAASGGERREEAVDPDLAQRLASLGYVTGSSGSRLVSGIDPKDRIATANELHHAVMLVEDGAFQQALPLLERVTAREPGIHIAQMNLGVARARLRQYKAALAPLRKAVELQPDIMLARYELGVALYETGDLPGAVAEFEAVAARTPRWADVRYSLGSVYARINRVPDAVRELREALALDPRHGRANLLLGRILTLQGDAASAVAHLERATAALPALAEAQQFLADAYEKAGRPADAAQARQRAQALLKGAQK